MIATCPNCATRYLVDPRELGASGRLVRCAQCRATWHEMPPEDVPQTPSAPPPARAAVPVQALSPVAAEDAEEGFDRSLDLTAPDAPMLGPLLAEEDRLPPTAVRRGPWLALGWAVLVVAVVGIAGGAVVAHDRVTRLWPATGRLYALVGFPIPVAGTGLELRRVTPSRDVENGLPTLIIQGDVVNISTIARDVPKLRVVLRDGNDHELQSWSFSATDEPIQPGASVSFRTSVAQPSEAATGVVVSFATGS
jgi:predicted Zn finger-like uncharacterized protein